MDKWSGSIEVGMTTHDPSTIDALPDTMTNQRSGTMMMSGCGILTNGKGTRRITREGMEAAWKNNAGSTKPSGTAAYSDQIKGPPYRSDMVY